jgi:hypothetical protein
MSILSGIGAASDLINGILDRVWPNPTEQEKAKLEAMKIALSSEMAIHATNQEEAKHPSVFVAGWRPAVGWIGASGFAYIVVVQPFLSWASTNLGWETPPVINTELVLTVLGGMLGFGIMRGVEGIYGKKRTIWRKKDDGKE